MTVYTIDFNQPLVPSDIINIKNQIIQQAITDFHHEYRLSLNYLPLFLQELKVFNVPPTLKNKDNLDHSLTLGAAQALIKQSQQRRQFYEQHYVWLDPLAQAIFTQIAGECLQLNAHFEPHLSQLQGDILINRSFAILNSPQRPYDGSFTRSPFACLCNFACLNNWKKDYGYPQDPQEDQLADYQHLVRILKEEMKLLQDVTCDNQSAS